MKVDHLSGSNGRVPQVAFQIIRVDDMHLIGGFTGSGPTTALEHDDEAISRPQRQPVDRDVADGTALADGLDLQIRGDACQEARSIRTTDVSPGNDMTRRMLKGLHGFETLVGGLFEQRLNLQCRDAGGGSREISRRGSARDMSANAWTPFLLGPTSHDPGCNESRSQHGQSEKK